MEHRRIRIAPLPDTREFNLEPIRSVGSKIGSLVLRPIMEIRDIAHELSIGLGNPVMKPEDVKPKSEDTR